MKKNSAMTEFFNTSNTADFLPSSGFNADNLILAMADVFSGNYDERHTPKKPCRTLEEIDKQINKVEKKLDNVLMRFIRFTSALYVATDNSASIEVNSEHFINLWEWCKEGDGEFENVTHFVKPDELYLINDTDFKKPVMFPAFDAFRRLHFLENRREELLDQREELLTEYWNAQEQKKTA